MLLKMLLLLFLHCDRVYAPPPANSLSMVSYVVYETQTLHTLYSVESMLYPVPHQNKDINNPWFLWCLWDQTLQCRVYAMPPLHTKTKKNIYIHSSYGVYETQILHTLYSVECMLCPRFTPKQKQKYISMVPIVVI